jgi:hypothetical protein
MRTRERQTTRNKTPTPTFQKQSRARKSRLPVSPLAMRTPGRVQPKLKLNPPGDRYEQEADRVAALVMRMPEDVLQRQFDDGVVQQQPLGSQITPLVQRQPEEEKGEEEEGEEIAQTLQRQSLEEAETVQSKEQKGKAPAVTPSLETRLTASKGGGESLSEEIRSFMEPRFGHDFSGVQVHREANAVQMNRELGAQAFTHGQDVYFGAGRYRPEAREGKRLLAHELAHVTQQKNELLVFRGKKTSFKMATGGLQQKNSKVEYRPIIVNKTRDSIIQKLSLTDEQQENSSNAPKLVQKIISKGQSALTSARKGIGNFAGKVKGLSRGANKSLTSLLGIPVPKNGNPRSLALMLEVTNHPLVKVLPGNIIPGNLVKGLTGMLYFLTSAWQVFRHPKSIIDGIIASMGNKIGQIPGRAKSFLLRDFPFQKSMQINHLAGIQRHLTPKIEYTLANWKTILKETAWDLLWPWPGVWKDLNTIWNRIQLGAVNLWKLDWGSFIDDLLVIWQTVNIALGRLYGWFYIAAVLIGGAFGSLPGLLAGAGVATKVGMALLVSVIGAETSSIFKASYDLIYTNQSNKANEEDYEQIANSALVLIICGVMYALGAVAAKFAKGVISRTAAFFRKRAKAALAPRGKILFRGRTLDDLRNAYFKAIRQNDSHNIEVGIYKRRLPSGADEYAVVQGATLKPVSPGKQWTNVSHSHPGAIKQPGFRNPAVQDFLGMDIQALRSSSKLTRAVHSLKKGGLAEVQYGVDPAFKNRPYFVRLPGQKPIRFKNLYPDSIKPKLSAAGNDLSQILRIFRTLDPNTYYAGWYARQFRPPLAPSTPGAVAGGTGAVSAVAGEKISEDKKVPKEDGEFN